MVDKKFKAELDWNLSLIIEADSEAEAILITTKILSKAGDLLRELGLEGGHSGISLEEI